MIRGSLNRVARRWHRYRLQRLDLHQIREQLRRRRGLVVLCYHSVRDDTGGYPYAVSSAVFRDHVRFLNENFSLVAPEAAFDLLTGRRAAAGGPHALLTFDDGFMDNLTNATPILEEFSTPALLFAAKYLVTSSLETFMSEAQLEKLAAHPVWTVGAHGTAHLSLTSLQPADVERDIDECAAWLQTLTGARPRWFAYPYGRHSPGIVASVAERFSAAYEVAPSHENGTDQWRIPRALVTKQHQTGADLGRLLLSSRFVGEADS